MINREKKNNFLNDLVYNVSSSSKKPITTVKLGYIGDYPILSYTSWDKNVTLYNIQTMNKPSTVYKKDNLQSPIFSQSFKPQQDPYITFGYSLGNVSLFDLKNGKEDVLYKHEIGVKNLLWKDSNTIISGAWDGKLIFYDIRMKYISFSHEFNHRIYAMDICNYFFLCGLSENCISVMDLRNMNQNIFETRVKFPITSGSINTDGSSFVIASNSGQIEVRNNTNLNDFNNYIFYPHQNTNNEIFSTNKVQFIMKDILCTGGSDGYCNFWDIKNKEHLFYGTSEAQAPIITFDVVQSSNKLNYIFVYAIGNDFSKGPMFLKNNNNLSSEIFPSKIGIHNIELGSIINKSF